MKPRAKVRAALGLILAAAVSVTVWRMRSRRQAAESLVSLTEQRAALENELRHARATLVAQQKRPRVPAPALVTPPAEVKPAPPAPSPLVDRRAEALRKDPALQLLHLKAEEAKIRAEYGELFTRLTLSTEQREAFIRNVLQRRERVMDLNSVAQSQEQPDREAIAAMRTKSEDEFQQAQRALLGENGFGESQTYERMAQPRETVAALAGLLAMIDQPLTSQQGAQLATLMGSAVDLRQTDGRITLDYADWPAIDRGAESILSGPQLAAFRAMSPVGSTFPRSSYELSAAMRSALDREVAENPPAAPPK